MTAHLAECPECAEELRELESTVTLLRRLPEAKAPPAFAASVMARVRAGEAEPAGLLRWLRALATPAFAVPLAAGLAGLVLFAGLRDGPFRQPGAEPEPADRVAVSRPLPAQAERQVQLVRAMQRRSLLLELARRGRTKEVALSLRGAGHPLASSMASHFEDDEPVHAAFASWSPGQ
jgi:anti-sigma factor RsiW